MLENLIQQYDLAGSKNMKLVRESADNIVYRIDSEEKKILRISKRLPADDLEFEHRIIEHLSQSGFPVPKWNKTHSGKLFAQEGDTVAVLFDFLQGYQIEVDKDNLPDKNHCYAAGKGLALLHNKCLDLRIDAPRKRNIYSELERALTKHNLFESQFEGGTEFIKQTKAMIEFGKKDKSVVGLIHNDYRPGNVFFKNNNEISGVIDFDWSCQGPVLKDLALAALEWSFPDGRTEPDWELFGAFLAGYNSDAKFKQEKNPSLYRWVCFAALSDASTYFCDLADNPDSGEKKLRSYMYKKFKVFSDLL